MKNRAEEKWIKCILCAMAAGGLARNVFAGFQMPAGLQQRPEIVSLLVFLVMAGLFAAHFSRWGIKISIPLVLIIIAGTATSLHRDLSTFGAAHIDRAPGLALTILILLSVLVFCSAVSSAGTMLLFLAGAQMTAFFAFLKYPVSISGCCIFVFSMTALLLFQPVFRSAGQSVLNRKSRFQFVLQPILIALIISLLAGAAYAGLARTHSTTSVDPHLVQKLMSMQLMEKLGISSIKVVMTDAPKDSLDQEPSQQEDPSPSDRETGAVINQTAQPGIGSDIMKLLAVTYAKHAARIWIAILLGFLSAAAAVSGKLLLRKKWYAAVLKLSDEEGAAVLYSFFLKKLKKAGFEIPEDLTLHEYAAKEREFLKNFSVYDSSFLRLTEIYQCMRYGFRRISYSEYELFHDFYLGFYKNLRGVMGTRRYCRRFFFL